MDEVPFEEIQPVFVEDATDILGYTVPTCAPSDLPSYQYESLPSSGWIRLLKIRHTLVASDPIIVELQAYELESAPKYYTLSYTWGKPAEHFPANWDADENCRSIVINENSLRVRVNLFHALACLRHGWQETFIWWIDAICINQQDKVEKGSQVKQMAAIFSKSSLTTAWLGPPDSLTAKAVSKLESVAASWDARSKELQVIELVECNRQAYIEIAEADFANARNFQYWEHMTGLFSRSWWRRGWILQEFALAAAILIIIGPWQIRWPKLQSVHSALRQHIYCLTKVPKFNFAFDRLLRLLGNVGTREFNELEIARWRVERHAEDDRISDLLAVLQILRNRLITDDKDKVFAGLGMLGKQRFVETDYKKSVQSIYVDAATACILSSHNLNVLGYCRFPARLPDLPSWCPDWSVTGAGRWGTLLEARHDYTTLGGVHTHSLWRAGGPLEGTKIAIRDIDRALILQGGICGTLSFVAKQTLPFLDKVVGLVAEYQALRAWALAKRAADSPSYDLITTGTWDYDPAAEKKQFDIPMYQPTGQNLRKAYFHTLCGNELYEPQSGQIMRCNDILDTYPGSFPGWISFSFVSKLGDRTQGITQQGFLALVPEEAQVHDQIAIILGNPLPLVLRPHRSGRANTYQFIGESYVHGAGDGELYEIFKRDNKFVEITIQ